MTETSKRLNDVPFMQRLFTGSKLYNPIAAEQSDVS